MGVSGSGFRVWGFRLQGFRDLGCGDLGLRCSEVWGFRVSGLERERRPGKRCCQ